MRLLLALFVALLATCVFAACPSDCNGINGHCVTTTPSAVDYCACHSGFSDAACATVVTSCDGEFKNITDLTTAYPPISVAVSFAADTLTVGIASPLVNQRNYTLVAIDDSVFGVEKCSYPGQYWSRSFDSCHDVFTGAMPWADNVACGWVVDNTSPSLTVYSAQMIVEHHDYLDPFANRTGGTPVERVTQHRVPLTVTFPKNVSVTSALTVQSPVRLLASISRQTVAADGASAIIEVTTNLLWPYRLTSFTIPTKPGLESYTPSLVSSDCVNDTTSSCTQVFRISIVTGTGCNLNGNYGLAWVIECQAQGQCAIQPGATASADLAVISEDFCTVISTTTPLTGALSTFGDLQHSQAKRDFLVGQTIYFHATVASANVSLTGTTINSVKLTSAGLPDILLYSGGGSLNAEVAPNGTAATFTVGDNGNAFADFHYTLTADFIDALADDSSRVYSTFVIVDVDYQDVNGKRATHAVEFQSLLNSQAVAVSASFNLAQDSASALATFTAPLVLAGAALAFLN